MLGFCIGFGVMLIIHIFSTWLYRTMLASMAEPTDRTAVCINGQFYYIVPEGEYVDMRHQSLCFKRDHGV